MSEGPSPIRMLRKSLDDTLVAFAGKVGVGSMSHMSDIERGKAPCPLPVALAIEALGREHRHAIDAAELCADVRLARETAVEQAA